MTKQQEIEMLKKCADALGADSYCGPWLRDQIPYIEHDMKCDILPTPSWSESRALHEGHINVAQMKAEALLKKAQADFDFMIREAKEKARDIKIAALNAIERSIKEIEK